MDLTSIDKRRRHLLAQVGSSAILAISGRAFAQKPERQERLVSLHDFDNEQAFINYVCDPANPRRGVIPAGRYEIRSPLIIPPGSARFQIVGEGSAYLVQASEDTPLILFPDEVSSFFLFDNISFSWKNIQSPTSENSYGIAFDCATNKSQGYYNFVMSRLLFEKGGGIGVLQTPRKAKVPIWGCSFRNIFGGESMTRPLFYLASDGNAGSPNIEFDNIYIRRDNCRAPSLTLKKTSTATLKNVEINGGSGRAILLESGRNFLVEGLRFEGNYMSINDSDMIAVSGSYTDCYIRGLEVQNVKITAPKGANVVLSTNGAMVDIDGFTSVKADTAQNPLRLVKSSAKGTIQLQNIRRLDGDNFVMFSDDGQTPERVNYRSIQTLDFFTDSTSAKIAVASSLTSSRMIATNGHIVLLQASIVSENSDSAITVSVLVNDILLDPAMLSLTLRGNGSSKRIIPPSGAKVSTTRASAVSTGDIVKVKVDFAKQPSTYNLLLVQILIATL